MQTKRFFQILIAILLFSSSAFSQIYIGEIVDSKEVGIGFAHVFFQNDQSRGSISNDIGGFSIFVTEENQTDTLVISVLGYETKFIPFDEIENYNNVIELMSSIMDLDEITVTSDSYFRYVLKEAIAKIPDNYPTEEHLLKGYYQNYTITDSVYSEMIEADFRLVSNGYTDSKRKERYYVNQLRKTDDNRKITSSFKKFENKSFFFTAIKNKISQYSLSILSQHQSLDEMIGSVDDIRALNFHSQSIQDGDTILTIKISDPGFSKFFIVPDDSNDVRRMDEFAFNLISVNLTNRAIEKMAFGSVWEDEANFDEVVYRKVDSIYYPSYIRSVSDFKFEKNTREYYNSSCILFYDLVFGRQNLKAIKKGKKFNVRADLREIKMKLDNDFWGKYPPAYQLPATTVLRKKFSIFK